MFLSGLLTPLLDYCSPWLSAFHEWSAWIQTHPTDYSSVLVWLLTWEWYHWILTIFGIVAIIIGTKRLLRWPFFLLIVSFLACELAAYFTVRYLVFLLEKFVFRERRSSVRELREGMKSAETYREWQKLASEADQKLGCETWKANPQSRYFNGSLLTNLLNELRQARQTEDVPRLMTALQACMHKNPCGILNEHLYSKTLVGTKYIIDEYVNEVVDCLKYLKEIGLQEAASSNVGSQAQSRSNGRAKSPAVGRRRRSTSRNGRATTPRRSNGRSTHHALASPSAMTFNDDANSAVGLVRFFQSAKRQYGCTALCLSGGASIGNYHWGTILALLDEGLLPRVVSGTSSGAVVAAVVCTRTDDELRAVLNPATLNAELNSFEESWFTCAWRFWQKRVMYDQGAWLQKLQWFAHNHAIPKMTFLEAHQRTGRILNITCTSQRKHNPSMLMNYLTTPNVCIDTAILASAAVPGFIEPVVLMEKVNGKIRPYHDADLRFVDGSLQRDLPLAELSEQFGANFFLVSQLNPHIIPFFFNSRGQSGTPSSWRRRTGGYRGGFLLSALELFLKEDMKKNIRVLSELDLVPSLLGSDFSFLFLQEFQGQITLVPNATLRDYLRIICDPTYDDLERYLHEGRLTAWRKFSMIRNRVLIGNEINACIRDLMAATRLQGDPNSEAASESVSASPAYDRAFIDHHLTFAQL